MFPKRLDRLFYFEYLAVKTIQPAALMVVHKKIGNNFRQKNHIQPVTLPSAPSAPSSEILFYYFFSSLRPNLKLVFYIWLEEARSLSLSLTHTNTHIHSISFSACNGSNAYSSVLLNIILKIQF